MEEVLREREEEVCSGGDGGGGGIRASCTSAPAVAGIRASCTSALNCPPRLWLLGGGREGGRDGGREKGGDEALTGSPKAAPQGWPDAICTLERDLHASCAAA
jgi:hypothetical protein